jgi:hypothetical protein
VSVIVGRRGCESSCSISSFVEARLCITLIFRGNDSVCGGFELLYKSACRGIRVLLESLKKS